MAGRTRSVRTNLRLTPREAKLLRLAAHRRGTVSLPDAIRKLIQNAILSQMQDIARHQISVECRDLEETFQFFERYIVAKHGPEDRGLSLAGLFDLIQDKLEPGKYVIVKKTGRNTPSQF